jgi:hypothetical protein
MPITKEDHEMARIAAEISERRAAFKALDGGRSESDEKSLPSPSEFLTLEQWRNRELPPMDLLLGDPFHTTTRILLAAKTGLGKTNLGLAVAMRIAAGVDFLHWRSGRDAKVLYIDGEMSRRLLKERLADEEERETVRGRLAANFHALNTEDVEGFLPLNSRLGQKYVDDQIAKIGDVEFVTFDNIMSLIAGNMKDEEPWAQTQAWANSLTKRSIGQLWIHHANDQDQIYGTKTRGWQMTSVILLTQVKREDTDVSFTLSFSKARERTPSNRQDFRDVNVCLLDNKWQISDEVLSKEIPPGLRAVIEAIQDATIESGPTVRAVDVKLARMSHKKRFAHDGDGDRDAAERQAWSRNFKKAVGDKLIAGENKDSVDLAWVVREMGK